MDDDRSVSGTPVLHSCFDENENGQGRWGDVEVAPVGVLVVPHDTLSRELYRGRGDKKRNDHNLLQLYKAVKQRNPNQQYW